ncbi:transposase, partial [Methylobacterium sp. J-070]|uniref:IS66 family transposase n=1 Tax=Methylobacterium sp. J-070 TaxID=2836650 RepID=UPI001FB9EA0C
HTASPTRSAVVVREMMDGHQPAVWISDRYTAQQSNSAQHQTCLAHLARDGAYVVEVTQETLLSRLQPWLGNVFARAKRCTRLATCWLSANLPTRIRVLGDLPASFRP